MDLGQLETFLAVVNHGSFTKAADGLYRTQSAVSLAIKRLEEEIGEPLFDRSSSKSGTLTGTGRTLLSYARRMLNLREEALASIQELHRLFHGRLSMVVNESISEFLLPTILKAYHEAHPAIRIEVYRSSSEHIPSEILERELDFGFLSYEPTDPQLVSRTILRDKLVLVVPPDHPLATRPHVRIHDLGTFTFLAHSARTPSRAQILWAFAHAGVPFQVSMELDSLHTIIGLVSAGMGAAILPRLAVKEALAQQRVVQVAVEGLDIERHLSLVHRREQALSSAAKAFLACLPV